MSFNKEKSVEAKMKYQLAPLSIDQRRHHIMELNMNDHDDNFGPQKNVLQKFLLTKKRRALCYVLIGTRHLDFGLQIVKSDVLMGEVISCQV